MTLEQMKEINAEVEEKSKRLQRAIEMATEKLPLEKLPEFEDAMTDFVVKYIAEYYAGGPQ